MIDWADVTPIIVTRGDVDLLPIIETLPFSHVVIWNNGDGSRDDCAVYGRYAAISDGEPVSKYIYVQDDDVILSPNSYDQLLAAHEPGHVTANMPQRFRDTGFYDDHCLVGFGAIFDRDLPEQAFDRFCAARFPDYGPGPSIKGHWSPERVARTQPSFLVDEFAKTCDVVFTVLTPRILVDLPYTDREFASAPNRMWKQPEHVGERQRMLELARKVRDAA